MQTKKHSVVEAVTNVSIGYCISIVAQIAIFPVCGISVPIATNLKVAGFFTIVSVVRMYVVRRWFNRKVFCGNRKF